MYDDRHNKHADDKHQNFRVESVHSVDPRFDGGIVTKRQYQEMSSP